MDWTRHLRRVCTVATTVTSLMVVAAPAYGQLTTGTILGVITDETGAVLPGAEVSISHVDTGVTRATAANERGRFEAPNLPAGVYEVTATSPGFGTAVRRGIQLAVGRNAVVDMVLPLVSVEQEMIVTGDAPLVETTSATVSNLVGARQVENLPLINRDLTQLTFLQPGVVKSPAAVNTGAGFEGMGQKFTVAGARGTQNLYLLDGVSNGDLSGNPQGVSGSYAGAEAIQEIQIVTNNYSAEYRSAAGGIVSAITKSGTNALRGSLFEFYRGDALEQANYFDRQFDNPKPDFSRHQFGGAIGGPIRRNKLFFFGSYEGLTEERGGTEAVTVPSVNLRQGRLANGAGVNVHPVSSRILNLYPVPGQGNTLVEEFGDTALIAGTRTLATDSHFGLAKVDYQHSAEHMLSFTYSFDRGDQENTGLLRGIAIDGGAGRTSRKHVFGTKWTTTLSNASVNEVHFGYANAVPQLAIPLTDVDFTGQGLIFRENRTLMGAVDVPEIALLGFGDLPEGASAGQRSLTIKEAYSRTSGNHSLRLGGEWTYYQFNQNSCAGSCMGEFVFADLRRFLAGIPRRFEVALGQDVTQQDLRQQMVGLYVQDNWRVNETLSLNLGLRYEFASVPDEVEGRVSNYVDFNDEDVTIGALFRNPTKKAFSPRVGFVWSPEAGTSSLRGGFGIFYDHPQLFNMRTSLNEMRPFKQAGRIDQRVANAIGQDIDFPNAYFTQRQLAQSAPSVRTFQHDLEPTYFYRWSLTYQRQFARTWVASADYTGSRGLHLWQQSSPNINRWEGWPEQPAPGTKYFPGDTDPIYPHIGSMRVQYSNANSYYHGGSLAVQRRLSAGLQFGAAFTYSKAIDDGSGLTSGGDTLQQLRGIYAWDMYMKRGLAGFDNRKVFAANLSYEVPWGADATGVPALLARGWQINAVMRLSDGYPLTVEEVSDDQSDRIGLDENLRPDLIPGGDNRATTGNPEAWFDISQFSPSRLGYFGDLGRNTIISPGLATVDMSVFKNIALAGSRLQVRFEIFNLFNRTNFGVPDMDAFINGEVNPTAGLITETTTAARQMQIGLRWVF